MVVIKIYSKFGWTIRVKNKNDQIIKVFSEKFLINSKETLHLTEREDGKEFVREIFTQLFKNKIIGRYSRYTALRATFDESFTHTVGNLLKKPVLQKSDAIWIDVLPIITKKINN